MKSAAQQDDEVQTLNSAVKIPLYHFGFNVLRLGQVGGAIPRRLSPIR